MQLKIVSLLFIHAVCFPVLSQSQQTSTNKVVEWEYTSTKTYQNPFRDVQLTAKLKNIESGNIIEIPAFWAGNDTWKFRCSRPEPGTYTFVTSCNDKKNKELHGKKGQIVVTPYQGDNPLYRHGPVHVSPDGKFLQHYDGTPFFWLADSWWHGMTPRLGFPEEFGKLATDRKQKGFTVIQFAIAFPCDIEPFDPRGQNEAGDPWDKEFSSINPAYFDLVDQRIGKLLDMGLMPNIVGLWGYYMKWMGPENVSKHWEYLIARYGAYPVTYTLSGETTLAYYTDLADNWEQYKREFREQWSQVAGFIQENDPYNRVLTTHPGPGINDGKNPINQMEYLDMIMLQSGHRAFHTIPKSNEDIKEYQSRFPNKPVIQGEVCFEGMFGSSRDDVQRLLFWSNVLQGTPGFSYGVEGIWQFNTPSEPFGPSPTGAVWGNVPWQTAMNYKGSEQIGHGATFLQKLPWWTLKPAPDRGSDHAGVENFEDPYVAEIDNGLLVYLTYKFGIQNFKVLGLDLNQTYRYTFFDPITGTEYPAVDFKPDSAGDWQIAQLPIMQDWVLWISER